MWLPPPSAKRRMADWLPRGEANFSWLFKLQDENNFLAESVTISPCTWGHSTPAPPRPRELRLSGPGRL